MLVSSAAGAGSGNRQIAFVRDHLCQKSMECGLGEIALVDADGCGFHRIPHLTPRWLSIQPDR